MTALILMAVPLVLAALGIARPGTILSLPTVTECRKRVAGNARRPSSVAVRWIWSSDGYGWGCRYGYADGSTGTSVGPSRF